MSDDAWTVDDDAAAALMAQDRHHPGYIAAQFVAALTTPSGPDPRIRQLVTPESESGWGDFGDIVKWFNTIDDVGIQSIGERAVDAIDVAYVGVFSATTGTTRVEGDQVLLAAGIITLVWRPEFDMWLIHACGNSHMPPDVLPRTSPGVAPS